jgi:hypothetical protein
VLTTAACFVIWKRDEQGCFTGCEHARCIPDTACESCVNGPNKAKLG